MVASTQHPEAWFSPPPPGPPPAPEPGPPPGSGLLAALRDDLCREVGPQSMAGPAIAVLSTFALLLLVLGLYVWLCVAVFAIF